MSLDRQIPASTTRKGGAAGIVVPHRPTWYHRIGARLIVTLIRLVSATLRYRWEDSSGYFTGQSPGPAIYETWHNRLILSMPAYYGYPRKHLSTPGMAALVSASKDGGFLAAILDCYKVHPVRGSSSRRGPQALLELTTWAERGFDLAITPDGPRGPCYEVQQGVMSLAQVTGLPIIPFSCSMRWKLQLNSWDRFQIPLPFSRCAMRLGKPIRVPREADDDQWKLLRQDLQQTLNALSGD